MPRFVVRLEDPDSEHFRETTLEAESKEAAKWWCEGKERRIVDFRLGGTPEAEEELKDLRRLRKEGGLGGREKARLLTHEQTKPYKVVSVREVKKP